MKSLARRFLFLAGSGLCMVSANSQVYLDTTYSVGERVEDLLDRMTLEEKVGQMAQVSWQSLGNPEDMKTYFIGSLLNGGGGSPHDNTPEGWADMYDGFQSQALDTRLGIPMIYGTDAVHGHNNLYGAVIFPHNIGMGCTRNENLVEEAARITATEVSATGVDWTFGPCVTVPQDERWGRTYEGFSEDPELTARMGAAAIRGFQGEKLNDSVSILACAKHYMGDGGTAGGEDQGNTILSEEDLRRIHMAPYVAAVDAGTGSIMASYNSWNGEKIHGNHYLLTTILKEELGFDGFIVSDWAAIDQLPGDYIQDIEESVNAGIDMVMLPSAYKTFIPGLISLVNEGKVSMERIDDANRRILTQKIKLGLFEHPYTNRSLLPGVGTDEHREVGRQAVRESMVVLKNKNMILPISKEYNHIHVAGKSADNLGYQCGGWTITWQGGSGDITIGTTCLEAIQALATGQVSHYRYGYSEEAEGADVAVVVIGERPYAEGGGDRQDLHLDMEDVAAVRSLYEKGFSVVTLIISGRPMIIDDIWHFSDAVIAAWLPGTEGKGITDILFGDYQPSGKLSYSWPASMEQIPVNFGDTLYEPFLPYDFGIDSFALPGEEDPPGVLSAAALGSGEYVEVTFNKAMNVPDEGLLSLRVNGSEVGIIESDLKEGDLNTLVLYPIYNLSGSDRVILSSPGGIPADDGSISEAFEIGVYNAIVEYSMIAGKVEAEDYSSMYGIQTEECSDEGGGLNVGYIETGDYLVYNVDIAEAGKYLVSYRVASETNGGSIKLQVMEEAIYKDLHIVTFDATGGWQNWITVTGLADLPAGKNILRLVAYKTGFNINWFEFTPVTGLISRDGGNPPGVCVYPVPAADRVWLRSGTDRELTYSIYSANGQELSTGNFRNQVSINVSAFPSGPYFVRIRVGNIDAGGTWFIVGSGNPP